MPYRAPTLLSIPLALAVALAAAVVVAHPGHEVDPNAPPHPNVEQLNQRLKRLRERYERDRAQRTERQAEDRTRLRAVLARRLAGAPISAPLVAELRAHAQRRAELLRIQYLAAGKRDHKSIARAERLLALANQQHEQAVARLSTAEAP